MKGFAPDPRAEIFLQMGYAGASPPSAEGGLAPHPPCSGLRPRTPCGVFLRKGHAGGEAPCTPVGGNCFPPHPPQDPDSLYSKPRSPSSNLTLLPFARKTGRKPVANLPSNSTATRMRGGLGSENGF